ISFPGFSMSPSLNTASGCNRNLVVGLKTDLRVLSHGPLYVGLIYAPRFRVPIDSMCNSSIIALRIRCMCRVWLVRHSKSQGQEQCRSKSVSDWYSGETNTMNELSHLPSPLFCARPCQNNNKRFCELIQAG